MWSQLRAAERAQMIARAHDAEDEYSKGERAFPGASRLRFALAFVALAGAILLVVAELSPLLSVRAGAVVLKTVRTGSHHSWAGLVIAAAAVVFALGAARTGARPALLALLLLGLLSLGIALAVDLPDVHKTGVVGQEFEAAAAHARAGLYLETLGAALLVVAGGVGLLLGVGRGAAGPPRSRSPGSA
jgi:hypothetical protein